MPGPAACTRAAPPRCEPTQAAVNDIAWTPQGRHIIAVDDDGVVAIWDVTTGSVVREIRGHNGHAVAVDVLGDGSRIASGGTDDSAAVWDVATGAEVVRVPTIGPVADVSGSSDGRRLLVIDTVGNVTVVDSATGQLLRSVPGRGALPLPPSSTRPLRTASR